MEIIIAFDPGNVTGYAVFEGGKVKESGVIKFNATNPVKYLRKVQGLYTFFLPSAVFIEEPFIGPYPKAGISLSEKVGFIKSAIWLHYPDALIETINNRDVKKTVCGKANAKKADVIRRINRLYKKKITNDNEADAVAIAHTAWKKYMPEKETEILTPEEAEIIRNKVLTPYDINEEVYLL